MKKRLRIFGIVVGIITVLMMAGRIYYRSTYPYGWSHCCIIAMMISLQNYADDHDGHYPAGEASPEASLSLLCRSNYLDHETIRGMTVPSATVYRIVDAGGLLGPDTCGWHYTEGLIRTDDPNLALLYCKQALGHNGQITKDGGRQVVFVGRGIEWITGSNWPSFLQEQKDLLAKRSLDEKSVAP